MGGVGLSGGTAVCGFRLAGMELVYFIEGRGCDYDIGMCAGARGPREHGDWHDHELSIKLASRWIFCSSQSQYPKLVHVFVCHQYACNRILQLSLHS